MEGGLVVWGGTVVAGGGVGRVVGFGVGLGVGLGGGGGAALQY